MMMKFVGSSEKKRNKICLICNEKLIDVASSPDVCKHIYHYKCLRNYIDNRLEKKEPILCPEEGCNKFFGRIANRYKQSDDLIFQNVLLSSDENQCCICFLKYKVPVASTDSCLHSFCCDCLKKWCTFKHECPMDRVPIKMLLISDFPGGHITSKMEPPAVEQDLNGDGDNDELINTTCEVCNSGQNEDQLLLCDNCNRGYHIYCLPVPLNNIPEGDWFCEQCENNVPNQQDEIIVTNGRLLRGLDRIIDSIQDRHVNNSTTNNNQQPRNTRPARRNVRSVRNIRQSPVLESEDDSEPESDILPTLRTRNGGVRTRRSVRTRRGVRTRGVRLEEAEEEDVVIRTRARRPTQFSSGSEYASDNTESSRSTNVNEVNQSESDSRPTEDEEPVVNQVVSNRVRAARTSNTRNALRRRRQGSLSSDIESEVEPKRKKPRLASGSTSNESLNSVTEDENDFKTVSDDSSTDEDTRPIHSPITTRLRARDSQLTTERARVTPPLPRTIKLVRKINEDSDEEQLTDEQNIFVNETTKRKKRLIIESDSSDDECDETRMRHVSTSSSLSTIPCRQTEITQMAAEVKVNTKKRSQKRPRVEPQDVYSNTSMGESTESDISDTWLPSTSKRQSKTPRGRSKRRSLRNRKNTLKGGASKRQTEGDQSAGIGSSQEDSKQSGTGRENHLPATTNDLINVDQRTVTRSFTSSGSILSEINDGQTSLRSTASVGTMSPSLAKKEKIVLTLKHLHTANNTNNNAMNATHRVLPVHRSTHHLPQVLGQPVAVISVPSTSITLNLPCSSSSITPILPSSPSSVKPLLPCSSSSIKLNLPCSSSSITPNLPCSSSSIMPQLPCSSSSNKPQLPCSSSSQKNTAAAKDTNGLIDEFVTGALSLYQSNASINEGEFLILKTRIAEKIARKDSANLVKSKVNEFVTKYMAYYLGRQRPSAGTKRSGGRGATVR